MRADEILSDRRTALANLIADAFHVPRALVGPPATIDALEDPEHVASPHDPTPIYYDTVIHRWNEAAKAAHRSTTQLRKRTAAATQHRMNRYLLGEAPNP